MKMQGDTSSRRRNVMVDPVVCRNKTDGCCDHNNPSAFLQTDFKCYILKKLMDERCLKCNGEMESLMYAGV